MNAPEPAAIHRDANERAVRRELAACYRLMHRLGMTDLIYNHITAKVPGQLDEFLINRYGLHYSEVTASNLLNVDAHGRQLSPGQNDINPAGFVIHGAVHRARPDVNCVVHTHTRAGMAVSAMECGLLPLTQTAMRFFGAISYHEFDVPASDSEGERMARDLGANDAMILRNHGLLACGRTIGEAFVMMYWLEQACKAQVDAMSSGARLVTPSSELATRMAERYQSIDGQREWAALLRLLDREDPGYQD